MMMKTWLSTGLDKVREVVIRGGMKVDNTRDEVSTREKRWKDVRKLYTAVSWRDRVQGETSEKLKEHFVTVPKSMLSVCEVKRDTTRVK